MTRPVTTRDNSWPRDTCAVLLPFCTLHSPFIISEVSLRVDDAVPTPIRFRAAEMPRRKRGNVICSAHDSSHPQSSILNPFAPTLTDRRTARKCRYASLTGLR